MEAHPAFQKRQPPREAVIGGFRLEALTPASVEEDFEAVMASAPVLKGLFGTDWPEGLTLEANFEDLARHAREFDAAHAFAWIIRDETGAYLGCAYLNPDHEAGGRGLVYTWIRQRVDRLALTAAFNVAFARWLRAHVPLGFDLTWISNDRLP